MHSTKPSSSLLTPHASLLTEFSLRSATSADAPAIRSLVYAALINPTGLEWRRFVVACSPDGIVVGCGQVKPHRDGSRELASIVVAPAWRGNGVARLIIEHLIDTHPGPLYLTCRLRLEPFYKKFGFSSVDADEMTPYFRKLSRLARMVGFVGLGKERLLVMFRPG